MATETTNLGLTKPDGEELYNIGIHNGNYDKIDARYGITFCTSGTRPGTPATKQPIFETDTGRTLVWDGDSWEIIGNLNAPTNPAPGIVNLNDVATPPLDSAAGKMFRLTATGNRTIAAPSNPVDGRSIVIAHRASGGARTLALTTGVGGFKFGSDFTALTATVSGTTDYISAIYNSTDQRWHVVSYVKGL